MTFSLKDFLLVMCGSAVGGGLRYGVGLLLKDYTQTFPWATLGVNILGCLLIGLFSRAIGNSNTWNLLLVVGLCGGFTTFSSFSRELITLLSNGNTLTAVIYLALSVLLGVLAVILGYKIVDLL